MWESRRIGDWELDAVQGKIGGEFLVTTADGKARYTLMTKTLRKDAESINKALSTVFSRIPKEFILSITPDHGTESLQLAAIHDDLNVTIYWPDSYSPEHRGTNESTNGLIREYFPKGKRLSSRTPAEVEQCQKQLNRRPKKILSYLTPWRNFIW